MQISVSSGKRLLTESEPSHPPPPPPPPPPHGIHALLEAYRTGTCRARDVVIHAARVAAAAGRPDWTSVIDDECLEAQLSRLETLSSHSAPLYGVPFAVKDNIDAAPLPTTAACPRYAYVPSKSAKVVELLVNAGAVLIGKTNMDQFATGLVGTRTPYGAVPCVFNEEYIGGGSSSGSAAVVAKGIVPFALATDTAGSGRVPAAFQNIVGLKPTRGRISLEGVVPACLSLDCVSVMALTALDAALVLKVIEARDDENSRKPHTSRLGSQSVILGPAKFPRSSVRVGIPQTLVPHMQDSYSAAFKQCCSLFETKLGALVVPIDFSHFHDIAALLYDGPWVAERYAAVGSFVENNSDAVDATVHAIIQSSKSLSAADAFQGQYRLKALKSFVTHIWDEVDILMVPSTARHPTIEEVTAEPLLRNSELGSYTNFVNFLELTALSLPALILKTSETLLPFGITCIAQGGYDSALLALGMEWQRVVTSSLHLGCPSLGATTEQLVSRISIDFDFDSALPVAEPVLHVAVVGAHLSGMPLHSQLEERGARLLSKTSTSNNYKLFALSGTSIPKPGLVRASKGGCQIEVEVYALPTVCVGSFLSLIPPPLGLGNIELQDGSSVHGFICEPWGIEDAMDISHFGGWRRYIASFASNICAS